MPALPVSDREGDATLARTLTGLLVAASALLSIVSWYTTWQGMALYLAPWFALIASLGVQSALVLVAWLTGVTESRRALLVSVYVLTAFVSVAFSYVALHGWFSARERPAVIERALFDRLQAAAGSAQAQLTAAVAEAEKHVLALDEMTAAEKAHGFISRSQDADPWLSNVRAAVAREAASYGSSYPEGQGAGLRYTAFERHATLARRSLSRLREAQDSVSALRAGLRPELSSADQLREFNAVWERIPWAEMREALHESVEIPEPPAYSQVVDHAASGQEQLLVAFQELFSAPESRHALALLLAAFIDVIVFLLAFASGPFVFGAPETRWLKAAAALDDKEPALFVRDLLGKTRGSASGRPRLEEASLRDGERQLVLLLASHGLAAGSAEDGCRFYLLDAAFHRRLVESLADRTLALRAAGREAAADGTS